MTDAAAPAGQSAPRLPAAVLWDLDGTLVDTEPYWMASERELVEAHGGAWTDADGRALVGNALLVSGEYIRTHGGVDLSAEQIVEVLVDGVVERVRQDVPWRPGVLRLLAEVRAAGVPSALVTMSWRRLADVVVAALPPGSFDVLVTGDEVTHGKPHPEAYLTAAARLGVDIAECVAIEDSPPGVASALASGARVLAVPHVVPVPSAPGLVVVQDLSTTRLRDLVDVLTVAGS